jgi:DNA-binding CsgD family transcriptional regulator
VLPASDRYIAALHELGEPAGTVASAMSVLWPLGRTAPHLVSAVTGLPTDAVRAGLADLAAAGIVEELSAAEDGACRGWNFRLSLVEHSVRESLGPLDLGNLATAAVEAVWAAPGDPGAALVEEADAGTYLPDRLAEAAALVDCGRAAAELAAAAERVAAGTGHRRVLRWWQAAAYLVHDPATRDQLMLRYAASAASACDYPAVRGAVEALLRGGVGTGAVSGEMLQEAVGLLVGAVSGAGDLAGLSELADPGWWNRVGSSADVRESGRALALCALGRWQEALALLVRVGSRGTDAGLAAVLPELRRSVAEMVLGRPERFRRSLAMAEFDRLTPGSRYAVTVAQADQLLGLADLRGAMDLLTARQTPVEGLPVYSRFLWRHLEGRWDEAMALARRLFADNRRVGTPALGHHLFPERVTVILFARGRLRSAARLAGTMREELGGTPELEHIVCRAEAEVARTLDELAEAARLLRRGLETARAGGQVYRIDELWAELAAVQCDAGDLPGARDSLRHLERLVARTDSERTRLLWLLGSARVLAADAGQVDVARKHLLDAVDLARHRGQPFETGVALLAAARQEEDPAAMLFVAYELFDRVGAPLWRFRVRAEMRQAGISVPGRGRAATESEQLLATMVSDGLTNRQVAYVLGLSQDAVANRLTRLFARTGARSRTELVSAVTRAGGAVADW